jgi:hypothetical protein
MTSGTVTIDILGAEVKNQVCVNHLGHKFILTCVLMTWTVLSAAFIDSSTVFVVVSVRLLRLCKQNYLILIAARSMEAYSCLIVGGKNFV